MASTWTQKIGARHAVVQAGMGGGISTAALAAAVSRAGGLGTVGLSSPASFSSDLKSLRDQCADRPFSANLLMPFVRRDHIDACLEYRPAVVSLFYGFDRPLVARLRAAGIQVWHQIGDEAQAQQAIADGADGLIAQGEEAGGHLAGTLPLATLVKLIRPLCGDRPLLAAGGIHDAASAQAARALEVDGVVAGTRFLLTPESNAHPEYKTRLLAASQTLRTTLFGLAWPAPHRVVANAATQRWCSEQGDGPGWARSINELTVAARPALPMAAVTHLVSLQRVGIPLYSPAALTREMAARHASVTPLYAGRCVEQIHGLKTAAEVVAELAAGFGS